MYDHVHIFNKKKINESDQYALGNSLLYHWQH